MKFKSLNVAGMPVLICPSLSSWPLLPMLQPHWPCFQLENTTPKPFLAQIFSCFPFSPLSGRFHVPFFKWVTPHTASLSLIFTSAPVCPKNALPLTFLSLNPWIISITTPHFVIFIYFLGSKSSTVTPLREQGSVCAASPSVPSTQHRGCSHILSPRSVPSRAVLGRGRVWWTVYTCVFSLVSEAKHLIPYRAEQITKQRWIVQWGEACTFYSR